MFTGPSVVTTLSISLVWIIYTAIPPFLLLHYAWVHRPDGSVGASLRHTCWVLWWISSFCGVAAILLLWLVYPKQVPHIALHRACNPDRMKWCNPQVYHGSMSGAKLEHMMMGNIMCLALITGCKIL